GLMDIHNRFHTDETFRWVRAEHLAIVVAASLMVLRHAPEVHWLRFAAAFVAIDLIGYIPGAVAYRRGGGGRIAPLYHHLYNLTHSYLVAAAAIALWAALAGGLEWAMLAIPIHLSSDRGWFGNTFKPTSLPFEP